LRCFFLHVLHVFVIVMVIVLPHWNFFVLFLSSVPFGVTASSCSCPIGIGVSFLLHSVSTWSSCPICNG
jgi:hypothetical protein